MRLTVCKKFNRREHSYLMILQLEADAMDPYVFVVKDQPLTTLPASSSSSGEVLVGSLSGPTEGEESSSSSSGSSSSGDGTGNGAESSSAPEPVIDCEPIATRILVSIASLGDLEVLPTVSPGMRQLYRAYQVALISRSEAHMNLLLEKIVEDLRVNAHIQGLEDIPFEIVEARDAVVGSNQDQLYHFR